MGSKERAKGLRVERERACIGSRMQGLTQRGGLCQARREGLTLEM